MNLITKEIKFSNPYTVANAVKSLSIIFNKNGRQFVSKSARILFPASNAFYFNKQIVFLLSYYTFRYLKQWFFFNFSRKAFIDSLNEKHIQVFFAVTKKHFKK